MSGNTGEKVTRAEWEPVWGTLQNKPAPELSSEAASPPDSLRYSCTLNHRIQRNRSSQALALWSWGKHNGRQDALVVLRSSEVSCTVFL